MGQQKSKLFNGFNLLQTGVNDFKYMYTIQNFSLRPEKTGEKIISPTFVIGNKERSEWCLHIYPNGNNEESKEYVSVILVLIKPDKAKVKFSFSVLNDKEEKNNTNFDHLFYDFQKGSGWGYKEFVKRDFLLNESNNLLFNDNLTILCEAEILKLESENHENSIPYDVLYISQTDIKNFKYIYTIQYFSLRPEKTGEKIISPTFVIGNKERSEWCLHIYPNGNNEESKEYVSVFLVLIKLDKAKVKFSFSILNDKEEKKNTCTNDNINEIDKGGRCGFPKFVKKDFLLDKSNGLLINDKLTILCEAEVIDLKTDNHVNSDTSISITVPQSKLISDYGNIFDSSFFYDCVIKVENTEIQVHKAILAARSPVFFEKLENKSKESQTNIVEIQDFSAEIVRNMLKYIYTDEVSVIEEQANKIFEIANEYKLDRLKAFSEQSMCNSLTIHNVLERFALSDKYPTERLKECCEELILKNMDHLKETEDWEKFIVVRPSLLQSLLFKSTNISSKEKNSEKKDKE